MRESETSDVTVILSERVRIRHVGMFQIVVDTSHPRNSLHTTQHHMVVTNGSRQLVERETRLLRSWPSRDGPESLWWQPAQVPHTCLTHKVLSKMQVSHTRSVLSVSDRRPGALGRKLFRVHGSTASLRPGIAHTAVCDALHRVRLSPSLT